MYTHIHELNLLRLLFLRPSQPGGTVRACSSQDEAGLIDRLVHLIMDVSLFMSVNGFVS